MPGSIPKILIGSIKPGFNDQGNWAAILSGVLLACAAPGIGLWALAWIGLVPFWITLHHSAQWREALVKSALMGLAYNGILFLWFWGLSPMTWLGIPPWGSILMVTAGYFLVVLTQTVVIGCIGMAWYGVQRRCPQWAWLLAPCVWTLGLWGFNQLPLGLPWGFLSYALANLTWIRESAYLLTVFGIETVLVFFNITLAQWWLSKSQRWLWLSGACVGTLFLSGFLFGPPMLSALPLEPLILQPNITIDNERGGMSWPQKLRHYQGLITESLQHHSHQPLRLTPDLVILPESMMTLVNGQGQVLLSAQDSPLLAGSTRWQATGAYNSVVLSIPQTAAQKASVQWLDKRILVPFGETLPLIPAGWAEALGIRFGNGFQSGSRSQVPFVLGKTKIGPLVCFEALYPSLSLSYKGKVDMLVTVANLGWYHGHPWLEKQFLAINQFRAAEVGVPLVLATNTGLPAIITNNGSIQLTGQSNTVGMLTQYAWTPLP